MQLIDEVARFYGVDIIADENVPLGSIRINYPLEYRANRATIDTVNNLIFVRQSMRLGGEEFYGLLDKTFKPLIEESDIKALIEKNIDRGEVNN